jgi:hypothetical protein
MYTLHSAVGFKQINTVADADYADEVLGRYESAIFTCGKFICGQSIYDKVLKSYSTPMTFKEYLRNTSYFPKLNKFQSIQSLRKELWLD